MTDLNKLTLSAARDGLRAKEFTSVELTEACLSVIEAPVRSMPLSTTHLTWPAHRPPPPMHVWRRRCAAMCGLPIGIKDLFCTKGVATQAASRILDGFKPNTKAPSPPSCSMPAR